jgi:ribosomal protein L24E
MWLSRVSGRSRSALSRSPVDLDHFHTTTPALAGFASTVVQPATAPGEVNGRATRRFRVAALLTATIALGGSFLATRPASAASTDANMVSAHGAPVLGSPIPGLTLPAVGIAATPSHAGYWVVASDGGVFAFGDAKFFGSTGNVPLVAPIVGLASTPSGNGYWLVANDGGVFAFGDAHFYGSLGGRPLAAPIAGIAPTSTGAGYRLVGNDGGVFAFGDAGYYGSAAAIHVSSPVTGIASSHAGHGYLLVSRDGGVFTYGDARFRGAPLDPSASPAVGIASSADGNGYVIVRSDGHVFAYGTLYRGDAAGIGAPPVVGIATGQSGYWIAHGVTPPPIDLSGNPFLACTRHHESDSSGGYHAVSPGGTYRGAYQFSRSTWDNTARAAGRPDLVGVDPAQAAPADQDFLALQLYHWQGAAPWGGRCAGL